MAKKWKQGRIVHPNWTMSNKYNAAFEPYTSRTEGSFRTYAAALKFLKRNGVNVARYKSSTGSTKNINMSRVAAQRTRR